MQEILYHYEMNATTWVYLSSLIMIAVYFKFRRFWSVRNMDILGLITFAPGLLMIWQDGTEKVVPEIARFGYIWLFVVGALYLVRLLLDSMMVRRPLLEPNLSASGLTFAGVAMLVFSIANVISPNLPKHQGEGEGTKPDAQHTMNGEQVGSMTESDVRGAVLMDRLLKRKDDYREIQNQMKVSAPGLPLFLVFSTYSNEPVDPNTRQELIRRGYTRLVATRIAAIIAHLAIVLAMLLIGYRHFDNVHTGAAAATLYLLLPYTAQYTPRVDHVVPAALMIWAVQSYRRPVVAGLLLGLAGGLVWFPLFLLPLWCSFYWRRGLIRFSLGALLALALLSLSLLFTSANLASFLAQWKQMLVPPPPLTEQLTGFWGNYGSLFWETHKTAFRYPTMAAFFALCGSMILWPAQKNLGSLLACSAAIMLGTQFWKAYDGGLYMAWYLPLLILTIFRPNLEDRVALSAISEGWIRWRRK